MRFAVSIVAAFGCLCATAMPIGVRTAVLGVDTAGVELLLDEEYCAVADGTFSLDILDAVESESTPKLTVRGLPTGLKYDAKTGTISGKATKPGTYKVTVSVTNATVKKPVTTTFMLTVPNFTTDMFTVAGLVTDGKYVLWAGVAPDLADVIKAITDDGWKLAVSGLPAGVKFDAKKGAFSGIATKEGFFTVYFTATRGSGKTAEKQVATATFEVAFPVVTLTVVNGEGDVATQMGKVTGDGKYPFGKKVALKATANKGFVFVRWGSSTGGTPVIPVNGQDARSPSVSFTMPSNDVALVAQFVTAEEDKDSIVAHVDGWELEPWVSKAETHAFATNVWAGVYLEWPVNVDALSIPTVKVSGLPSGLKFAAKPVTTKIGSGKAAVLVTNVPANTIYGAPTAASKTTVDKKTGATTVTPSVVKVTVTTAGKSSQTYQIDTIVDPLPAWAQGTFNGVVGNGEWGMGNGESASAEATADERETGNGDDGNARAARSANGIVSLTVSAAGKVSGKAQGDGLAYTLAAPYYSGFEVVDDGESLNSNFLADVTASWSYKDGSKTVKTNDVVQMSVRDNVVGGVAMGGSRPVVTEVADATESVPPFWTAWQYNWAVEPWQTLGKSFDKKTIVYAILSDGTFSEDEEVLTSALGADVTARVTLKFSAKGTVTVAGEFVSGYDAKKDKYTTVKASGSATLVPVDGEHGAVFIYLTPKGLSPHARARAVP